MDDNSIINNSPKTKKNSITKEDRLEILISDINRKMNRFEDHISREHLLSNAMIIDKERTSLRIDAERKLRVNVDKAKMLLSRVKELGEMPPMRIVKITIKGLRDAIIDSQSVNLSESLIAEAKEHLLKLQELEDSLVSTL